MTNLVTSTPSRFTVIRPEFLGRMQVLETIDTDAIITARMTKLKEIWMTYDPPNGAAYDVENTEFDPLKIQAELAAYFELMVRDRVNQACRAVTLAFAVGSDLDAIASRYPYGMPRLPIVANPRTPAYQYPQDYESDVNYRRRIWLSPSILSLTGPGMGTYESYVFWALSAPNTPPLKDAMALTEQGTGHVYIPILNSSTISTTWTRPPSQRDSYVLTPGATPAPSFDQINTTYAYINAKGTARKGLTDYISVMPPKVSNTHIDADIYLFRGVDRDTLMTEVCDAVAQLVVAINWIGADLTLLALQGALAQVGVYNSTIKSPAKDVLAGDDGCVNITSVTLRYAGVGE